MENILGFQFFSIDYDILTDETTDNLLLYGKVQKYGTADIYYYITVLDPDYNVLYTTTNYSTGTSFNQFIKLTYDDEGRVWGIDISGTTTETGSTTPRYRLILLNNIATPNTNGEYEVVLRKSYLFPIGYNKIENNFLIQKIPGQALYYILSNDYGYLQSQGRIISIEINVGSSNEWYQTTLSTGGIGSGDDMLIEPYNDDFIVYYTSTVAGSTDFIQWVKGSAPSKIDDIPKECSSAKIISSSQIAFIFIDGVNELWEFCMYNGGTLLIFDSEDSIQIASFPEVFYKNGLLFYCMCYEQDIDGSIYSYGVCGIYDGNSYINNRRSFGSINISMAKAVIKNNYSLYNIDELIIIPVGSGGYIWSQKMTYYSSKYNGSSYIDYNSLVPERSELYDTSNNLIFARQLYNLTTNKNITTSTLEVPNNFLNNVIVGTKTLIGETVKTLVSNDDELSKNIYEKLYINFVNTINVIDEDTNTNYLVAGSNITTNINSENNDATTMNNKRIGNLQINYQDGTNEVVGLEIITIDNTHYTITNTIYVNKEISTIDIVSKDATETYITLDASNLSTGTYYTLNESLRIE